MHKLRRLVTLGAAVVSVLVPVGYCSVWFYHRYVDARPPGVIYWSVGEIPDGFLSILLIRNFNRTVLTSINGRICTSGRLEEVTIFPNSVRVTQNANCVFLTPHTNDKDLAPQASIVVVLKTSHPDVQHRITAGIDDAVPIDAGLPWLIWLFRAWRKP